MRAGNNKSILTAKGESTLIDIKAQIKYKRRDILKELFDLLVQECAAKGIEFIWGFNNIPATYKRVGCENPFKSSHGVLILKPGMAYRHITSLKPVNSAANNFKIAIQTGLSYLFSFKKVFIPSQKVAYIYNHNLNENEELFFNASYPEQMTFLLQDKNYLQWKISENPYRITYKSFQLFDKENRLVGQVIWSVQKEIAFIEQTLFDSKINNKQRQYVLKKILCSMKKENICLVRFTGFHNNKLNAGELDLFKNLGFIFSGRGEWFTFKKISSDSIIDPKNIYLSRMYKQGII